ncbi:MAG: hypothetical protein WAV04_00915 [Candidatus Microsaccharimonas sp.]
MRSYLEKHRLLYGHIGAIIALIVAVIYLVVIPGEVFEASGIQKLVLLYGHSLCWVLLSIASYLWGIKKHRKLTAFFAYSAFITYIIFIGILMITKSA